MTLSYSRDLFCCFVTSQDLTSFWDCHRRAFEHFGGVPATIVYDRTKTVVHTHVRRHQEVPLHAEALAFAAHYGFSIVVAPARRPQFKGRVERQVSIVRHGVLDGRRFTSVTEMDGAFAEWLPTRRAQVHRTHGEIISVRAERDRAALGALGGQGLPGQLPGQLLFGSVAIGAPGDEGGVPGDGRRGGHLEPGTRTGAAGHPRPSPAQGHLGSGPLPLGRPARGPRRRAPAAL
jgi:hypothetical protein